MVLSILQKMYTNLCLLENLNMYNVLYTKQAKQAKQDIHEIYNFIAHDNELYAEKVVQSITGFVGGMLAVFPNI